MRNRIDAPACRDDVRAAAHEVGGQVVRQAHCAADAERRPRDRAIRLRRLALDGGIEPDRDAAGRDAVDLFA